MKSCLLLLVLVVSGQAWAFHPNDDCSNALLLTIPSSGSMSTVGATTDPLNLCSDATPQNGVWFRVVGDGTLLRFGTCSNSSFGLVSIQVFSGICTDDADAMVCVGGNDDTWCSSDANGALVTWCSVLGTVYYIHLGAESGFISSPYGLVSVGPCNYSGGNCVPQYVLAPATVNGTTINRDDCCYSDGADHHYAVYLPYTSSWNFRVCNVSGSNNSIRVSNTFCGDELCYAYDIGGPIYPGCAIHGSCLCAPYAAGVYHVTIEWSADDGQGELHKLQVIDCNSLNNPNIVTLDPTTLPTSCELVHANEPLTVVVQGDHLDVNEPPMLVITGGCDDICTGGGAPATWHFDEGSWSLEEGMPGVQGYEQPFWQNTIVGLTDGSVCLALEGFLGVELASFTALPSVGEVILNWETESEQDLSSFKLYRDDEMIASLPASNNATGERYVYRDRNVVNEHLYAYTLYAEEMNGELTRLATASATPHAYPEIVGGFALMQNYPNPFNPETTIEFSINEPGDVQLRVFDLNGREVAVLVNGAMSDGVHSVKLDASSLSSGIYFYRLEHKGLSLSKKLVLLK